MNLMEINVLVLAYLGDTIYEDYIRKYLILKGINNVNDLQKSAILYVSAVSQSKYLKKMIDENYLFDDELDIVMRARNYKNNSHPKNCDIITYKYATGLEALIGFLELDGRNNRIVEIMNYILEGE